jgi:tRNA A37 threonylcarbamoyladenosine biosynthesis protein TsaE
MAIEWGDKFPEILPHGTLRISIAPQPDGSRLVSLLTQQ